MAGALDNDPINQLEVNLKCTVCQNILTDPRTLPCCHSFCKNCLESIVEKCCGEAPRDQPIREFPCPNCQATFTLDPDKHVADMRNLFISNMIKATAILDRGTGVPCSHNCSQSYSVVRCVTCEKFLCRECLTAHNNYRANNQHSVLTMEELSKPENRKKINDKMYCSEHSGMELKVYCKTCDQLICRDCMDFKHVKQDHLFVLVKDEANKYKELLASNNKAMEDALTEGNAFLEQLTVTTEQLDRNAENAKDEIGQREEFVAKKVLEMLAEKAKSLCKEVDEIHKDKRTSLDRQTEETKLYVESIKTSVQLSKKLVDQGTEEEIISSQKMMLDNSKNLQTNREKYFKAPIPDAKLGYTSPTSKEPLNENILKRLVKDLRKVNVGNEAKRQEPDKMSIYDEKDNAHLATSTPKNSFRVTEESSSLTVQEVQATGSSPRAKSTTRGRVVIEKLSCDLFQDIKAFVYQGDITKETVDVIVNSTNEELKHSGGLARAIVKAGGKSIQDESSAIMKKHYSTLNPGEVALTHPGNLRCKFIIHAVGPKWVDYYRKDTAKKVLLNAVFNCLTKASHYGATSITIPAISSGIYAVPVQICAEILFTAAIDFFKNPPKPNSLKEIRFVNIDKPTSQVFAQEMKKRFGTLVQRENVEVVS